MQSTTQADSDIAYFTQHTHNTLSVVFPSCSVSSRISSNFQPSRKANDSDDRWGKIHITDWILLNPTMKTTKMAEITCIIFRKTYPTGQHVYHNFCNMNDTSEIHLQQNQLENNPNPSWKHRCRRKTKQNKSYRCKMLKCAVKASARE